MKLDPVELASPEVGVPRASAPAGDPAEADDLRTRDRLCREVTARGPVTAPELAAALGLTASGVRRHLDELLEHGLIEEHEAPVSSGTRRGRGRPARHFVATEAGHAQLRSEYDDLAAEVLRFMSNLAGPQSVRAFATSRFEELERKYRPQIDAAGHDSVSRAQALAQALADDGYASSARPVRGENGDVLGVQLCQGHCPVHQVAAEFPELCEAETAAFSRLLGVHVQRLATLAHGEHVCTTHVPTTTAVQISSAALSTSVGQTTIPEPTTASERTSS